MATAHPHVEMLSWYSEPDHRLETVRIVLTDRGLRANGYLIQAGESPYGASYSVLADASGRTRRISVHSDSVEGERSLSLTRSPGGPWVVESTNGSSPLYALDDAQDVDIEMSAFTNALTLRRVGLNSINGAGPEEIEYSVTVASIEMPSLAVRSMKQFYTLRGNGAVSYRGSAGDCELTIDDRGFVVDFPGLSHRLG